MSDKYSYDSAVAREAEANLAATMSALENNLAELGGFVAGVTANWEGDEQELYRGVQNQWDNAAAQIAGILAQVKTSLGQTTESVETMRGRVRGALQA
ncbi:WXG100 family type VII secretion target [Herbidospora daliensis]|uniref:WXG100 family type VII secretion target n=1 Tax=Herbidospora daliensis TaxID=295585 RepID=UPI0007833B1C|nr:WXG100 family type VII secretion target [Herbidospora daliensis]